MGKRLEAEPAFRARLTVEAGRRVLTGAGEFFASNRALVGHAKRAAGGTTLRYYWRGADRDLYRVTIESHDTERGPVTGLEAQRCAAPWGLTQREHEVLTCVAVGMTNPETAARVGCGTRTVATHVENVLAKLEAPTRAAAAALAVAEQALLAPFAEPGGEPLAASGGQPLAEPDGQAGRRRAVWKGFSRGEARRRPIRLGAIYPLEGSRRFDAQAMRRGAAIAVDELNARGGVAGRRVDHLAIEISGDTDDDLLRAVDYLRSHDVDAITLGNVSPRYHLGAITRAAEYRAPLLHSMVAPSIAELVHDNPGVLGQTFQVCATETAYLSGFIRTLDLLTQSGQWRPGNRRVVAVVREDGFGAEQAQGLDALAAAHGWRLAAMVPVPDTGVAWPAVVAALRAEDPAAVLVCTYIEDELRAFLRELRGSGLRSQVYTVWTPTIPRFGERMEGLAEGLLWSTVIGTYGDPLSARFIERYRRAYGDEPGSGSAAIHYDMIHMLAGAWATVGRPWDFGAVVRSLRESVHRGAAGPYYFGGRGQRALAYPDDTSDASLAHAHLVYQVQDGRSRVIAPVELSHHRFRPLRVQPGGHAG
ncbi:ABC transporter substrate-binding protein [Nonomuraea sp. NPDC050404]|uniref:ABC transporter substrate-binding protein n=1 Tax=Nonomuraea sp. NPDC050404 TaxID=3155783 RepID=UPI0033D37BB3